MVFSHLTVLERAPNYISPSGNKGVMWKCQCDCGKIVDVHSSSLTRGIRTNCGCLSRKAISEARSIDLSNKRFGKLTALRSIHVKRGSGYIIKWECKCDCGATTYVATSNLISGKIRGCGCTKSFSEKRISEILTDNKIKFRTQYTFDDLRTPRNGAPRFDFALFDKNDTLLALLEYQGKQHYIEPAGISTFGKTQRDITDNLKKEYCDKKEIPLYEIRYDDDLEAELSKIISILYGNPVPSPDMSGKV